MRISSRAAKAGAAVTVDELRHFLEDKLSSVELPRLIELRETLPRTAVGKLSKKELVEEVRARATAGAPR